MNGLIGGIEYENGLMSDWMRLLGSKYIDLNSEFVVVDEAQRDALINAVGFIDAEDFEVSAGGNWLLPFNWLFDNQYDAIINFLNS